MLLLLAACNRDLDAPPALTWDHDACTHCSMLVSEPRYAAALVTNDGRTLPFDDPGCLFHYVAEHTPSIRHMWFHDESGWLDESRVAFLAGGMTPMGSGLRAVPAGTPGSLGVGEASGHALEAVP